MIDGTSLRGAPGWSLSQSMRHPEMSSSRPGGERISTSALTSTARTVPISGFAAITSIGRLFTSPPSTCRSSPRLTGGSTPGSAMLARIARTRGPRSCTVCAARERLVDTHR